MCFHRGNRADANFRVSLQRPIMATRLCSQSLCCLFVLQLNHVHTFEYMWSVMQFNAKSPSGSTIAPRHLSTVICCSLSQSIASHWLCSWQLGAPLRGIKWIVSTATERGSHPHVKYTFLNKNWQRKCNLDSRSGQRHRHRGKLIVICSTTACDSFWMG